MFMDNVAHASASHLTGSGTQNHDEANLLLVIILVSSTAVLMLGLVARLLLNKDSGNAKAKVQSAEEKAK